MASTASKPSMTPTPVRPQSTPTSTSTVASDTSAAPATVAPLSAPKPTSNGVTQSQSSSSMAPTTNVPKQPPAPSAVSTTTPTDVPASTSNHHRHLPNLLLEDTSRLSLDELKAKRKVEQQRYEDSMKELDLQIKRKQMQDTGDKCVKILDYHKQLCKTVDDNVELWTLHKLLFMYEDAQFENRDSTEAKQLFDEYHSFILSGDRDTEEKSKLEAKCASFFKASTRSAVVASMSSTPVPTTSSLKRKREGQSTPAAVMNDDDQDDHEDAPSSRHLSSLLPKKIRNRNSDTETHGHAHQHRQPPSGIKPTRSPKTKSSSLSASRVATPSSSSRAVSNRSLDNISTTTTPTTARDITIRIGSYVAERKRPKPTATFKLKFDIQIHIDMNVQRTVDDVLELIWDTLGDRVVLPDQNSNNNNDTTNMEVVDRKTLQFNLYRDGMTGSKSEDDDTLVTSLHDDIVEGGTYLLCPTSRNVDVFVHGNPTSDSFQIAYTVLNGKISIEQVEHRLMKVFGREKAKFGVVVVDSVHEIRVTKLNVLHSTVCAVRDKLRPGRKSVQPNHPLDGKQQQQQRQEADDSDGDNKSAAINDDEDEDDGVDEEVMEIVKE